MLGGYSIEDDWIDEDGRKCYEVRLFTSCCKGDYSIWRKNSKEYFFIHNSEKCPPGMIAAINGLLKTYEQKTNT